MTEAMPEPVRAHLVWMAERAGSREIVGAILADWTIVEMTNIAPIGAQDFRVADDEWLHVNRTFYDQMIGIYHSHPQGRKEPSNIDLEHAPQGLRYWIITPGTVHEWNVRHDPPLEIV